MTPYICVKCNVDHFLILLLFVKLTYLSCHAIMSQNNNIQCVDKERHALARFKSGLVDDFGYLSSWGGSSLDCCQWHGIRCDNSTGNVISLNLAGLCIGGTLDVSLLELKHLKYLDVSFNDFRGQTVPKFIASFHHLEYLDLSDSFFSGVVTSEFGNLSRLSYLDLSCQYDDDCYMSIVELSWLSRLKLLRYINLNGIDLSQTENWMSVISSLPFLEVLRMDSCSIPTAGTLPSSVSYMNSSSTLQVISLNRNVFKGTPVFQWLHNLSRIESTLTYLDLSCTFFSDEIPSFIWKLTSLSYLNLEKNHMRGQISNEIGNMKNLSILRLNNNDLSGPIPSEIWNIESLSHISFAGNRLDGAITNIFTSLKQLTYLDLSHNNIHLSRQALKSFGKSCRLQRLGLGDTNLTYEFSEVLESLSQCAHKTLVSLQLSNTKVWGSVPDNISKFSSLERLYAENNQLNGTISEEIGRLSSLQHLDLSSNNLTGVVSHNHFLNLSSLSVLELFDNQALVLNLSAKWTPLFQLHELKLRSCTIGPSFPKWLLTQQKLAVLDISSAGINDVIPKDYWGSVIHTLRSLNMSNNMIHGVLPDLSFTFQKYTAIDMSSNNLSGALPSFLRNNVSRLYLNNNTLSHGLFRFLCPKTKTDITFIDLSNNLFSDTLPDCWEKFSSLTVLQLQNNNITGNLPPSIFTMYDLQALHLRNNSLSGELPRLWVESTSLVVLDLAYNSLSGSILPTFWQGSVNIGVLNFKNNHFSKSIPSSLCQLNSLQILDLSSNYISGALPKCLYDLTKMAQETNFRKFMSIESDFESFIWNRKEHKFDVSLGLLKGIDISNNNLQGQIPDEISSLAGLVFLNLSQNHLSGHIPSRIGQLTSLNFLDLSNNHLSGEIPTSLTSINSLGTLDLSKNKLTGKIPLGTQLQGFNASSYMGNPGLCGAPLPECSGDQANHVAQNKDNIAQQKVHKSDVIFPGMVISVVLGVITGFWGVCGTLVLKRSWRIAFFRFYDETRDKIYVMVVLKIIRPCRRFLN